MPPRVIAAVPPPRYHLHYRSFVNVMFMDVDYDIDFDYLRSLIYQGDFHRQRFRALPIFIAS
jgi:hypothetical protein